MVSSKLKLPMFYFNGQPIKKLFRKISLTSLERLLIGVLFDQVADLELSVNFAKYFRTILCRANVTGCFSTLTLWLPQVTGDPNTLKGISNLTKTISVLQLYFLDIPITK